MVIINMIEYDILFCVYFLVFSWSLLLERNLILFPIPNPYLRMDQNIAIRKCIVISVETIRSVHIIAGFKENNSKFFGDISSVKAKKVSS